MNPKKRDWVSQSLYHMCKQNWQAKRKSRKDQTPMKQPNTGHEKEENKKKWKLPSKSICPSPFKSAVLMISLTSSSVNWLPRFIIVHLNSSALINPLPSMSDTEHFSYLCFCLFLSSGCPSVEKLSKVNDAIALKKNVNLVQFKLTESDRSISFHPTTAFLALSLLDLISNSPDCLQYNSCYVIWRI